jgi:hypothetical protein
MMPALLIARHRRRPLSRLVVAFAAGLVAIPLAGIGNADNGGGATGGAAQVSDDSAWPPTEVYWPPTQGTDSSSNGATDGSEVTSVLPTPIVLPGAPPILPDRR